MKFDSVKKHHIVEINVFFT
jgi:NAD(P)-dependent dehydrogenase (short-subunit alcohol dehydrogenase family)